MQTREQVSSTYESFKKAAGPALNQAITTGGNVASELKKPIQTNTNAANVHAAGFIFFTSASAIELISGSWLRFGIDAAAATYCMAGLINQEGRGAALNFVKGLPSKTIGLFRSAQAAPAPSAPAAHTLEDNNTDSDVNDSIKIKNN